MWKVNLPWKKNASSNFTSRFYTSKTTCQSLSFYVFMLFAVILLLCEHRRRAPPALQAHSDANDSLCFNGLEMVTHRLGGSDSGQGGISHPVLLNLTRGGLPAHVQAVGGGVVHLDVPGWRSWDCRVTEVKRKWGEEQRNAEFLHLATWNLNEGFVPSTSHSGKWRLMDLQRQVMTFLNMSVSKKSTRQKWNKCQSKD